MARLFFALPVSLLADPIVAWRAARPWPGEPVPATNLHLTLAFLGEVTAQQRTQLEAIAARLHCPPLTIPLDSCGWFGRAKAAWIGPERWPNELSVLVRELQRHCTRLGLGNGELHYRPHITLSRKAAAAPEPAPAPDFVLHADSFCLYQSVSSEEGVRYEPLACWPLRKRVTA
ncbi:RNA 2',3'-cyclic phosphodiesterase [Aeromonas simiae]|uniref:RNA 2',3'-cyclic phosphodiesterase n=1 Tax=Aeromonas simiae TaxID=218936 RepID=UPI0005AA3410|nr:RNA 2',3'-cyclic phosphodiesterase [Aeromonas simiae]MDO2949661.1 RNA 2',3'-cyclic phosphodiesterase [Aeromonas simiae]MDO2953368.1 RNA 2',3'-cyclic phosphodiesterase [Aeromonas simiae]MDO2956981.1 RNA 2',3'-cyclic phosphodiesterase [Aeromonas simiae]